ncbi:MAG TPA: FimV/HubP family polar landmark protein [Methylophilaceae bacterium]
MLAFSGLSAEAASLGKINVLSNLGQPLNAEITLLPATPEELAAIKASIASKEAFAEQGVTRSDALSDVTITVATLANGQSVLRLTSTAPISQPATDVLVQVDWGTGSLTRLYTVVLAPSPTESAPAAVDVPAVPAASAEETTPAATGEALPDDVPEEALNDDLTAEVPMDEEELPSPDEQVATEDAQEQDDLTQYVPMEGEMGYMVKDDDQAATDGETTSGNEESSPQPAESADELPPVESAMADIPPTEDAVLNDDLTAEVPMEELPPEDTASAPVVGTPIKSDYAVGKGDTLRNIAVQMGQPDVSLEQMMVGLYHANPQAFVNNDMNRLKKGQIMRVPTAEELSAIDQASAEKEVQAHVKNWNAYRNKVAGMVAKSAPAKDDNQSSSKVSGKITSVRDQSEASGPRDVVKLSSGIPGAGASNGKQTKAQMQEQLIANQKALAESNERIALLQKQLEDAQKLLALRDQAAAADKAGAGGKDAVKTGSGPQTSMDQLLKDPKIVPKAAGLLAVLFALWLLLRRKKENKAKKAEAPTSAVTESAALADSEVIHPEITPEIAPVEEVSPEAVAEEVSATDLVQEMQQAMQAADSSASTSTAEQEMVEAMQAANAEEEAEPSWADAGLPLPEETPEAVAEAEPSWADAGLPLPEEPAAAQVEEAEPSWADAGLPLPEEPADVVSEAEPSWADAGLPLPEEEPSAQPAPEAVAEPEPEPELNEDVLSIDDVETLMPEGFEPAENVVQPVVALESEPTPPASAEMEIAEVSPATDIAGETFDVDDVFDSDEALADMLAGMPEEAEAEDEVASAMKEEAAMDEMVAAAMEEGDVDAENQFDLDDVFAEAAPQITETATEEASANELADLVPEQSGAEADIAPAVAADDHSEALAAAFDESATKDLQDLDFGFDVDLGEVNEDAPVTKAVAPVLETPAFEEPVPKKAAAKKPAAKKSPAKKTKKVEVEDIDLDVTGADAQAAVVSDESAQAAASAESAEIDTMLDLVTAYIDMSDEEGARDLLKEILEKGGPEQKAKAQKMLDDLG